MRVGKKPPAEAGFRLVGAHTDSPNLRLKPKPGRESGGWLTLDVEVYGSPILATWVDRDLGLAGRVVVREKSGLVTRLVRVDRPLCRISTLAIHLARSVNEDGLKLDRHLHLSPALALWDGASPDAAVLGVVGEAAGVDPRAIRGFDLCLYDVQKAAIGGSGEELVFSARLDNLTSCRAALSAIAAADPADATAVAREMGGTKDPAALAAVLTRFLSATDPLP
jgi:aspartyl aminopeptidase